MPIMMGYHENHRFLAITKFDLKAQKA